MTDGNGTTSSLTIIKPEAPRPLSLARMCQSCGGYGRLMFAVNEERTAWMHLNAAECGREEEKGMME